MGLNKILWILKLGGAAITDKNSEFVLRDDVLDQACAQLKEFQGDLIIVHGAGSFAHNLAKKYNLAKGRDLKIAKHEQYRGIVETRRSLHNLHNSVLDYAIKYNLLPLSFPVSSIFLTHDQDEMDSVYLKALDKALSQQFIPILYGDITMDVTNEFRIVSGDRIIKELSRYFKGKYDSIRILFGTNVDGLYDKDPAIPGATLIENLKSEKITEMIQFAGESGGTDVTGGMKGKLEEIQSIVELGNRVQIFNLTKSGRLLNILNDRTETLTDIVP